MDLDKAWHGIHYLLTGSAGDGELPLGFLVGGGEPVGVIEVGYGPARVLDSAQLGQVRDALRGIRDEDLRARFDPKDMLAKEILPEIWDRDPAEEDAFGYLLENFRLLRKFVDETADAGLGVVLLPI